VFSSGEVLAQTFYYTNNNPEVSIVPFGGTWTYSVTLYGGTTSSSGTYLTLESLATPERTIELGYQFYTPGTYTYTFSNVSASDAASYSSYSLSTSGGVTAGVQLQISPGIVTQPTNTACAVGSNTTMGLVAGPSSEGLYGDEEVYYQWFNSTTGVSLTGTETTPSFALYTATSGESVYCRIYNSYGEVDTDPAVLTVGYAPIITIQPTNVPATFGGSAMFSVSMSQHSPQRGQSFLRYNRSRCSFQLGNVLRCNHESFWLGHKHNRIFDR
jgi:hypothetical protein